MELKDFIRGISDLETTIQGSDIATGLGALEPETGGQFKLKQNYPNPFTEYTIVPFTLANNSDVKLELYDLTGRKVGEINRVGLNGGNHELAISRQAFGLTNSNYIYQIHVTNSDGTFTQRKMMTAAK